MHLHPKPAALIKLVNLHAHHCRLMQLENQHYAASKERATELWAEITERFPEYAGKRIPNCEEASQGYWHDRRVA